MLDLLIDEWRRKPVAIATVSGASFGGTQVITSLLFLLWKIKAWVVTHMPVPKISDAFNEDGTPADPEAWAKRATHLLENWAGQWKLVAEWRLDLGESGPCLRPSPSPTGRSASTRSRRVRLQRLLNSG